MALIEGTPGNDTLTGNPDGANTIYGYGGDDLLRGGGGLDIIGGGDGNDTIYGATRGGSLDGDAGNDVIFGGADIDNIDGGAGNDRIDGGGGGDQIRLSLGSDALDGGAGGDTLLIGATLQSAGSIVVNFAAGLYKSSGGDSGTIQNFESFNAGGGGVAVTFKASDASTSFSGSSKADVATGGAGNDLISGEAGDDRLNGGAGQDTLLGGAGNDTITAGGGADRVLGGDGDDILTLEAFSSVYFDGGAGFDLISYAKSTSAVTINLATGANGGDAEGDVLISAARVSGSSFSDRLTGDDAANVLAGDAGNDTISAGGGADRLLGGLGSDQLRGGSGADKFTVISASDSTVTSGGRDFILDFSRAQGDKIDVSGIDANEARAGDQDFSFIGGGAFTGAAGQLRFQATVGDGFIFGDTDGDRNADFAIRVDDITSFVNGDFIL